MVDQKRVKQETEKVLERRPRGRHRHIIEVVEIPHQNGGGRFRHRHPARGTLLQSPDTLMQPLTTTMKTVCIWSGQEGRDEGDVEKEL